MRRFIGLALRACALLTIGLWQSPHCFAEHASVVSAISASAALPESIQWHDDLASGWQAAKATGRPMVIFITSSNCRYCDAMKQTTWIDREIRSRVSGGFVAIRLTPEHNSSELSRVNVQMYPTTIVALAQGKVIDHQAGFQPSAKLHHLLDRVQTR